MYYEDVLKVSRIILKEVSMLRTIINNLELLELPAIAFIFTWLTNFQCFIYYNVGIIKEIFEAKRLFDGIIKMIAIDL